MWDVALFSFLMANFLETNWKAMILTSRMEAVPFMCTEMGLTDQSRYRQGNTDPPLISEKYKLTVQI